MKTFSNAWPGLTCASASANELQYRVNFFIQLLQSIIALAVGLIGLGLVFATPPS